MSQYLKPQSPLYHEIDDAYIYPLTTADQVITDSGERLNSLFKKTIKENITLLSSNWSETLPYTQTITLTESIDDYNVDANIVYDNDNDNTALNKAAGCLSYIKKNHKEITFYCLKNKPEVDIPIEITGTCRNTIATVEEGIKLNFDVVAYSSEEELLADAPMENTIGVVTDVPISGYRFSATEPENVNNGEVWIETGKYSNASFNIIDGTTIYPLRAKQMVDGTLVAVEAMSFQEDEWVSWINYLYNKGDEWTGVTGGWVNITQTGSPTFTQSDGKLRVAATTTSTGGWRTKNKIVFTDVKTIEFDLTEAKLDGLNGWIYLGILSIDTLTDDVVSNIIAGNLYRPNTIPQLGTISVDTTSVQGEYYVYVALYIQGANAAVSVDEIKCL